MILAPSARKLLLAIHLTMSVGWLGAVVAYIPLDLTVALSDEADTVRGAWGAMDLIATLVLVPLALASLLTGLLISLGTRWGLLRHWWVVVSLVLTLIAVVVLLNESRIIVSSAAMAAAPTTSVEHLLGIPPTLPHSIGGLVLLLIVQWLNVFKPQGLTPYGWRRQQEERERLLRGAGSRRLVRSEWDEA
jgi:hypothetical protein